MNECFGQWELLRCACEDCPKEEDCFAVTHTGGDYVIITEETDQEAPKVAQWKRAYAKDPGVDVTNTVVIREEEDQ